MDKEGSKSEKKRIKDIEYDGVAKNQYSRSYQTKIKREDRSLQDKKRGDKRDKNQS